VTVRPDGGIVGDMKRPSMSELAGGRLVFLRFRGCEPCCAGLRIGFAVIGGLGVTSSSLSCGVGEIGV